ncbi:2-oxoglutarate dehydrogenase-like, mitochondrial isoform X2 [Durio zibethinus]|uniref:2-oxoglutarate dehydrogenase-like, mitochondrial isoform X2 n=1 Tax=Durio zibethinus TaxID=66656 RepID=A0A6P6AK16_DURZI|nr:2-oxoglutarate dehydrogenase-like, mitochondrial isoform X2 [Durio zibethinus]XP_022765213.1 2-oxoglutarate dehydrogenase-like, mitochondrial isoform X2 [Durio zibethinus]
MLQLLQITFMFYHDREFRKPLIVMSPKKPLRYKFCKLSLSKFDDVQGHEGFGKQGTRFKRLIKDQNNSSDLDKSIGRLVLCSGKEEPMNMGAYVTSFGLKLSNCVALCRKLSFKYA